MIVIIMMKVVKEAKRPMVRDLRISVEINPKKKRTKMRMRMDLETLIRIKFQREKMMIKKIHRT